MAFKCLLATPLACMVDTEVWQVTVPAKEGRFSIRSRHMPIVASLEKGIIEVAFSDKERKRFMITFGIVEHKDNQCHIICDQAENME